MRARWLAGLAISIGAFACTSTGVTVSPSPPASPSVIAIATPSPAIRPPSEARGAAFTFEPGPVEWCGLFRSYVPPNATRSGELVLGPTTFAASSGGPAPFSQRIGADVQPGAWVCVRGQIARSETTANLLTDFSVDRVRELTMPAAPIRGASPCGLIDDLFVEDMPSGGFISVNGTKLLVGGARPPGDQVALPADGLRKGLSVCVIGSALRAIDPQSFEVTGGRVVVMR